MTETLILSYEGNFTQEITQLLLSIVERKLNSSGEHASIKRKVFNVMVEALQNIVKHSSQQSPIKNSLPYNRAIFRLSKNDKHYCVMTKNSIAKEEVIQLIHTLNDINNKDQEELKKMYQASIKNTFISKKSGAGLGLIDIARKSGEKIKFMFSNGDATHDFFSLKINIARTQKNTHLLLN